MKQLVADGIFSLRPYFCIGRGSNLLLTQKYYDWTFLHSAIRSIEVTYENRNWVEVRVGSGVVWDDFVRYCVEQNGTELKIFHLSLEKWERPLFRISVLMVWRSVT